MRPGSYDHEVATKIPAGLPVGKPQNLSPEWQRYGWVNCWIFYLHKLWIMHHLAIMNPKRKLIPKILSGVKTIESRRYMMKVAPRNKIQSGDVVWFKDAGKPVTATATVDKVLQYDHYTPAQLKEILDQYGGDGGIAFHSPLDEVYQWALPKKYCILIFLKDPKKVSPFEIDKTWYWCSCAWISIPDISQIQRAI